MKFPFRRGNDSQNDLPKEVQEYYQNEKRQRRGVAGLLAIGTLLATVVLALGLFFGGRWLYRSLSDRDSQPAKVSQSDTTSNEQIPGTEENKPASTDKPSTESSNTKPQTLPGDENDVISVTGSQSTGKSATTQSDLPKTGPADTAAIFAGTVLIASVAHYSLTAGKRRFN